MPHTNPPDLLLIGPSKPLLAKGLEPTFTVHKLIEAKDREAFLAAIADRVQAFAVTYTNQKIDAAFMQRFPKLEIVSSFGVGYDHIDAKWAGAHGILVTNTPDVLNEEVADTALGLLLCTVRGFPQAERHLRAGKWEQGPYPLTRATLRNRTVGLVGMGRIGQAIARRLDAFGVPVVYHRENPTRTWRTSTIRTSSPWRTTWIRCSPSSRAGRRPATSSTPRFWTRSARTAS